MLAGLWLNASKSESYLDTVLYLGFHSSLRLPRVASESWVHCKTRAFQSSKSKPGSSLFSFQGENKSRFKDR